MSAFDLKTYIKETEELVNIDSGTSCPAGVLKVGEYFKKKFETLGGWTIRHAAEATTTAPCWEIFNKDDKHFDVMLLCHIDTVFPEGTVAKRPFSIKDGRMYGPGSYDMKTGGLSAYYAMEQLQKDGRLKNISVCIGLNAEEEVGSKNARKWIESLAKRSDYVLICEPARAKGEMVIQRKGLGRLVIEVKGKSAHAGVNPQDGVSAILLIADWIKEIHAMNDFKKGTTLNAGLVRGGTGVNVVADYAATEVDIRLEDPEEYPRIMARLEELKEKTAKAGGSATVSGGLTRPVMNPTDKSREFAKQVDKIGEKVGVKTVWIKTGGGSDGNFTGALGIPTLDGFGPIGGLSHTDDEYVEIDSIEPRLNLLRETIAMIGDMKK